MNLDLAMMALDGLIRSPLHLRVDGARGIEITANGASFKELARICLLLGSQETADGEEFELQPGIHVDASSPTVRLRVVAGE